MKLLLYFIQHATLESNFAPPQFNWSRDDERRDDDYAVEICVLLYYISSQS